MAADKSSGSNAMHRVAVLVGSCRDADLELPGWKLRRQVDSVRQRGLLSRFKLLPVPLCMHLCSSLAAVFCSLQMLLE